MDAPTSAPAVAIACRSPAARSRPAQPGILHARRSRALRAPAHEPHHLGLSRVKTRPAHGHGTAVHHAAAALELCAGLRPATSGAGPRARGGCAGTSGKLRQVAAIKRYVFRLAPRARARTKRALGPVAGGRGQLANQRLAGRLPDALAHAVKDLACARGAGFLARRVRPGRRVTTAPLRCRTRRARRCVNEYLCCLWEPEAAASRLAV